MAKKLNVAKKYEFTVVAVDVAIFTVEQGRLNVLLIKMQKEPYLEHWALPGGLVRPEEAVDDAARRHLVEKTGVKDVYLEQLHTFGEPRRDPFGRVVSVCYMALIPNENLRIMTTDEYGGVRWFPVSRLPQLAYDHAKMTKAALERLRAKLGYTNIVYAIMPKEFTLTVLQNVHEMIAGKKLDKRNFRKRMLATGFLKKLKRQQKGRANRPADLYACTPIREKSL